MIRPFENWTKKCPKSQIFRYLVFRWLLNLKHEICCKRSNNFIQNLFQAKKPKAAAAKGKAKASEAEGAAPKAPKGSRGAGSGSRGGRGGARGKKWKIFSYILKVFSILLQSFLMCNFVPFMKYQKLKLTIFNKSNVSEFCSLNFSLVCHSGSLE